MKKRSQKDTWRREYVRLLTEPGEPWTDLTPEHIDELERTDELIQAGYMHGKITRGADSSPIASWIRGPTLAGRLFAEKQEEILAKKTLLGRIKSGSVLFIGWLSGIISALIIWYFTK